MKHLVFASSWIGSGATPEDAQRCPAVDLWQANGVKWVNLRDAGQEFVLPEPNVCVWECDWVEDAGLTLLEASPDYYILIAEDV